MLQKVNRRQFLKRVGATCAAAVAVPATLIAAKKEPSALIIGGQDSYIGGIQADKAACDNRKWVTYNVYDGPLSKKDIEKFRAALKNTKFKPPVKS